MNRRSFLRGGLIGTALAAVALCSKEAMAKDGNIVLCKEDHEPMEEFVKHAAICISADGKETFSLVPCKNCGVMFGVKV